MISVEVEKLDNGKFKITRDFKIYIGDTFRINDVDIEINCYNDMVSLTKVITDINLIGLHIEQSDNWLTIIDE